MKRILVALAIPALLAALAVAAEVKLEGVKCIVAGNAANASASADYGDGKVYFCCNDCKATFQKDPAKYATKANHQLVATGQAKQTSCPISGEPISKDKSVKVNGAEVWLCCDTCKDKVAKATGDAQMNLVFSAAAWKKGGFKVGQ